MCPVCTVTVVAGLSISRYFGIDDLLTAIWIGGFILSFSFVFHAWMLKKWPRLMANRYSLITTIVSMYALGILPLINAPTINRILQGVILGSVVFLLGVYADKLQRKKFDKIFFPFQKVVFPVLSLIIATAIAFLITNY